MTASAAETPWERGRLKGRGGRRKLLFGRMYEDASIEIGAFPPGGRVFIHEALLDDSGAGPLTTATFSLVMLLGTQGRQFTYAELAKLLGDAGFTDVGATPSYGYYSVVRATRR